MYSISPSEVKYFLIIIFNIKCNLVSKSLHVKAIKNFNSFKVCDLLNVSLLTLILEEISRLNF